MRFRRIPEKSSASSQRFAKPHHLASKCGFAGSQRKALHLPNDSRNHIIWLRTAVSSDPREKLCIFPTIHETTFFSKPLTQTQINAVSSDPREKLCIFPTIHETTLFGFEMWFRRIPVCIYIHASRIVRLSIGSRMTASPSLLLP